MGKLWLEELELHNVKQHADRTWQFVKAGRIVNLIGLIGPNGSGKSTILDGLLFLFTGEVPQENKADLIGWGDPAGKSYVRAKFLFDGKQLELYREAHSTGAWMKMEGLPKRISGITAVNRALEEVLGIDKDLCQKSMFVRQNDIIDILFTEPAKRKKAWIKLMGMGEAENIHTALGNYLSGLPPSSDHTEELENHRLRIRGILSEMHRLRQVHTARVDMARELFLKNEIARLGVQSTELNMHIKDWTGKKYSVGRLEPILQSAIHAHDQSLLRHQTVRDAIKACGPLVDGDQLDALEAEYSERSKSIKAFETVSQVAEKLEKDYDLLEKARKSLSTFTPDDILKADAQVRQLAADSSEIGSKLELNKGLLKVIESKRITAECPLCLQPVANAEQLKTTLNQRIADMGRDLAGVNKALDGNRQALQKMQNARYGNEKQVALLEQGITNLNVQKDRLVTEITASVEASELLGVQQRLQALQHTLDHQVQLGKDMSKADSDVKAAEAARMRAFDEYSIAKAALDEVVGRLSGMPAPEAIQQQLQPLQQELAQAESNVRAAATLAGQWKGLRQAVQGIVASMRELSDKMDKERARREAIKVLEDVRNFFHHSQGPTLVVSRILEDITGGVNEFLGHFSAPYTVVPDFEQMSFRCLFIDGRAAPEVPPMVTVLSGGEKVTLALSFSLAGYYMFSSRIGLISIDEPTNHLDERNIDNFRHLMERLKVLSQETGLQILISTHARSIIPVLDYVIDLGTENKQLNN